MIFLTVLLFCALLFVVPGELALHWLAGWIARPGFEEWMALLLLNVGLFSLLLVLVRFTRIVLFDLGWEHGRLTPRLAEWLDVSGWRWLNLVGFAAIATGVSIQATDGNLPYPFWFLFGAIAIGLLDVIGGHPIVPLAPVRPRPRFGPAPEPAVEPTARTFVFNWELWRPGSTEGAEPKSHEFVVEEGEYLEARQKERFPTRPVREYVRYVSTGFSPSVRRVAEYFRDESAAQSYSSIDEVMNVVGFVRGIKYQADEETRGIADSASFPIETLYDQAGDCEDHAILAAALLHNLGHDVGLFHLQFGDSAHLALGYRPPGAEILPQGPFSERADNGREYYYVETVPTDPSKGVGEISDRFLRDLETRVVVAVS